MSDVITLQTDDAEHFRDCMNTYLSEGYTVSSTGCVYGQWQAILINNQPQVQPIVRTLEEVVEILNKISRPECDKNSSHCHFSETDCKNYWHEWLTRKEV